jgi:hypothetical protein
LKGIGVTKLKEPFDFTVVGSPALFSNVTGAPVSRPDTVPEIVYVLVVHVTWAHLKKLDP